jgi:prophage regulatory protein
MLGEGSNREEPRVSDENRKDLIKAKVVAALLSVSERTLWRMVSAGEIISPIRFGGNTRWRRVAIDEWIEDGCPPQRD